MPRKCPNNMFCITNLGMTVGIICLILAVIYIRNNNSKNEEKYEEKETYIRGFRGPDRGVIVGPNVPYTNVPRRNVLLNPFAAPYRDERYITATPTLMPINVPTNISAVDAAFRQVGIITPLNKPNVGNILPLMGRPLITRRGLWNYYTISNQHNNVKLPVLVKNRPALSDSGVDEVYDGDTVYVQGYDGPFRVTKYEADTIRYLPNII